MNSIANVFIIGNGPSSSHTIGPGFACDYILKKYKNIKKIKVFLFGSLALTGKGHLTDFVISQKFKDFDHEIFFNFKEQKVHPNTLVIETVCEEGTYKDEFCSLGGGAISINGFLEKENDVYKLSKLEDIKKWCLSHKKNFYEFVLENEPIETISYIKKVFSVMLEEVERGQNSEEQLPGKLKVNAKAKMLLEKSKMDEYLNIKQRLEVMSAAYAAAEENARGHIVVTAPTCGSCGVIPGVIKYLQIQGFGNEQIIEGLCVAGLIGQLIKTNGSISGAVAGCQAEIGAACSMAAALCNHVFGNNVNCVAQAAEIALEHSLGLTCDPVDGYVQIPCIERNAIYAQKAIDSSILAACIDSDKNKIIFDDIVITMLETGHDMSEEYKETSKKGLAKLFSKKS